MVTVTLRRPVAIVDSRALVVAGTCANPRGEVLLGRKGRCSGTHFGNDLLRRIHSQTGHLGQSLHLVLMLAEQIRHLLIELPYLLVDQVQLL